MPETLTLHFLCGLHPMTPIPLAQDSGFQIAYSSSMRKLANGLSAFDSASKCLNVIVETPKGSRHKYAYLPEAKLLELKRALPAGLVFPFIQRIERQKIQNPGQSWPKKSQGLVRKASRQHEKKARKHR